MDRYSGGKVTGIKRGKDVGYHLLFLILLNLLRGRKPYLFILEKLLSEGA